MQIVDISEDRIPGAVETIRAHSGSFFSPEEAEEARMHFEAVIEGCGGKHPVSVDGERVMGRQLVAVEGDRVLGTMGYRAQAGAQDAYRLSWVSVHPDATRRGVGRALWDAVRADLVDKGARLVYTWTSTLPYTQGPRMFYERLGFTCTAVVPDHWEDGDDLAIYARRLDGRDPSRRSPSWVS